MIDEDISRKGWWSSQSVFANTPLEATPLAITSTPTALSTKQGSARYHKAVQGFAVSTVESALAQQAIDDTYSLRESEHIKQYQAGKTDVVDIESLHLGTRNHV